MGFFHRRRRCSRTQNRSQIPGEKGKRYLRIAEAFFSRITHREERKETNKFISKQIKLCRAKYFLE